VRPRRKASSHQECGNRQPADSEHTTVTHTARSVAQDQSRPRNRGF
jgi:hypothetical protein